MAEDVKKTETFHRKKKDIPKIIHKKTDNHEVVYGARALNKQFPPFLREETVDFDIYSKKPKEDAKEVEQALDNHFGGDYFSVEPAQHPNTWKVKGINGKTYADYTKKPQGIQSKKIDGVNYQTLKSNATHIKRTLKDETAKYRWKKDRDALNRIKLILKNKIK
jgi:hypothetical protein